MIRIKETVDRISSIYQTYDPFEICAGMGILVARISLTESVRGICYTDENGMAAGINEDLPLHIAKFVCAHELGHLIMHRGMNSVFMETKTLMSSAKIEKQANMFAMCLLFPDDDEFLSYGDTIQHISIVTGCREALVKLRISCIKQ